MAQKLDRLIARDAALCEAMSDELKAYLRSNELFWEPNRRRVGGADLPKLALGGLLLARRRLETLRERLTPEQARALGRAGRELAYHRSHWRTRYQTKLARDLRSRLDAWDWYLDDCREQGESAIVHYARQVEARVKVDLLMEEAEGIGLEVEKSRQRRVALDERLQVDFVSGGFCWLEPLAVGFEVGRFWYLWGGLKNPS